MISAPMTAQPGPSTADPNRTELEQRRGTFPLTPSTPATPIISTIEPTAERTRPRQSDPPPHRFRSVSASENPEILEQTHRRGESEYDRLVGQTLDGRYFVIKKIGEGGMGVVFSARHSVIERPLAIKVLKREVMRDTATIRRFVQEAQAASRIGHPNIVDVTDFGTTPDGMTYSVMEYVPGVTLGAAIRDGAPFGLHRTVRIAAQIARALGAAHDKGIVHRDLKPENVFLLDRDGRQDFVKIVDFGIAKVTPVDGAKPNEPRLTRAGSVFGTPEYMAPEQAAGRNDTDGRVDIYALGVILYEMICGKVPHRGDSMVRTLAMQMLDPVVPPSQVRPDLGIAPDLEAVILHALTKKREQRFQTMGELLAALEAVLPAPVAQSVTGSPVYTLAALPPGADPGLVASVPHAPIVGAIGASTTGGSMPAPISMSTGEPLGRSQPPGTTRRPKDEPAFATANSPVSFDHVFTDEYAAPQKPRRWPMLLLGALIVGGAAGAIGLVLKAQHDAEKPPAHPVVEVVPDAGPALPDATVIVALPPDAALEDAAPPADAEAIVLISPDGPRRHRDAGQEPGPGPHFTTETHQGTFAIQIITKPEGANLYVGTTYRGPGGATLEEPLGTKLDVTCRQIGYKNGTVSLVFDGHTSIALCPLERIKVCIPNIKNPFDDCKPDAPP
jgi:serine/threonine protein kinase